MSRTIDERIVEMRFDNRQFERNVQTSLSTLDKLKQGLDLDGAAKGLENLGDAAKKCNMSALSSSVETVRAKFSALEVVAMTTLSNITNSALNTEKRLVSALTIDPIKTGFQEYETQIGAVQTILANTQHEGTNLQQVNRALDELNTYADKTIYNFTEMTRNIGTFTAAGVKLQTSVDSIKGIANLAAISGSTSQQASTAMYQLSQALAAGRVSLMDWNSVVNAGMGGNDEREQTLNQLLTEMDGFDAGKGVVILAATNRPEILDKALLRPGRFDRRIPVELPDLAGREAILRVHAKDVKTDANIDYTQIARATSGCSGAELANIINEAAIAAVKDNRKTVSQRDMEEAIETVIAGYQRKNAVVSPRDKLTVSYHECGHALVAAKLKNAAPVQKITIIPRTSGALGYTMQVDEEERLLMTREQILDKITTFCGGRAAEQLIFGRITSGASNDIEQATKLARAMITRLGMSDTFGMMALETQSGQYLSGDSNLVCSDQTAARIDVEVKQIIANCYEQAYQILSDNKEKLHETAKVLLEKETITGMEFMAILAPNQLPSAEGEKAEEKPEEKTDDSADDVEVK